jgi:tRNA U34 5-carboxymethylaminomethyl modifying enzyme MnmG/GidA
VNSTLLAVVLLCALPADEKPLTKPVQIIMTAVEASNQTYPEDMKESEKHFDLKIPPEVCDALKSKSVKYNTFKMVAAASQKCPATKDAKLKINAKYTLFVTPLSQDIEGRVRVAARIEEKKKDKDGKDVTVKALETVSKVAPDKPLLLGGPKLEKGTLAVVISVKP